MDFGGDVAEEAGGRVGDVEREFEEVVGKGFATQFQGEQAQRERDLGTGAQGAADEQGAVIADPGSQPGAEHDGFAVIAGGGAEADLNAGKSLQRGTERDLVDAAAHGERGGGRGEFGGEWHEVAIAAGEGVFDAPGLGGPVLGGIGPQLRSGPGPGNGFLPAGLNGGCAAGIDQHKEEKNQRFHGRGALCSRVDCAATPECWRRN